MDGRELYLKYTDMPGEYRRLLFFLFLNIGEDLYPLLEKAEKEGKKLSYDDSKAPVDILDHFDRDFIFIS